MTKVHIQKEFNCEVQKVFQTVTDNHNCAWRSDLSKIAIIDDKHFVEYTKKDYPTYFTITSLVPCQEYRLSLKIPISKALG